jgi:hypothetical protein
MVWVAISVIFGLPMWVYLPVAMVLIFGILLWRTHREYQAMKSAADDRRRQRDTRHS